MEAEIQNILITATDIELSARPEINTRPLRFIGYFAVSTLLPLFALLVYMNYAAAQGIVLEKGCHGPGVPFSFFSGILFAIQLRLFECDIASSHRH